MRTLTAVLAITVVVPFSGLRAQQLVMPGDRVRLLRCDPRCQTVVGGRLVQTNRDTLFVARDPEAIPFAAPLSSITWVEIGRVRRYHVAGAVIGSLVSVLAAVYVVEGDKGLHNGRNTGDYLRSAGVAAAGGFLLGLVVGGAITTESWEGVPPNHLRVGLAPQLDGRVALGLSVAF